MNATELLNVDSKRQDADRAELLKAFRAALAKGRSVGPATELRNVNAQRTDHDAVLQSIRDALGQPRIIDARNGTLRALPLRAPNPQRSLGAQLTAAVGRT